MPRASKVCGKADCPHLQPCPNPEHAPIPWKGSTRSSELPRNWRHIRRRILERDPICTLGTACGGLGLSVEVHHVGGKHDHSDGNLAGTCSACHKAATSKQAAEARSR